MKFIKTLKKWQTSDGFYFGGELKAKRHEAGLKKVKTEKKAEKTPEISKEEDKSKNKQK